MTEKKSEKIASILAEGKEAPIGEFKKSLARVVELVVKNYPEIAEKIKAQEEEEMGLGDLIKWTIIGFVIFAILGALGRKRD